MTAKIAHEYLQRITALEQENGALKKRLTQLTSLILAHRHAARQYEGRQISMLWLTLETMAEIEKYLNLFDLSTTLAEPYGGIENEQAADRVVVFIAKPGDRGDDWASYVSTPLPQQMWLARYPIEGDALKNIVQYGTKISRELAEFLFPSYAATYQWRR